MRGLRSVTLASVVSLALLGQAGPVAQSGVAVPVRPNQRTVAPRSAAELRESDALVFQMAQAGDLMVASVQDDSMLPGRRHETMLQYLPWRPRARGQRHADRSQASSPYRCWARFTPISR